MRRHKPTPEDEARYGLAVVEEVLEREGAEGERVRRRQRGRGRERREEGGRENEREIERERERERESRARQSREGGRRMEGQESIYLWSSRRNIYFIAPSSSQRDEPDMYSCGCVYVRVSVCVCV